MPKYTPEQLRNFKPTDATALLDDEDSLIASRESLDTLSDGEQRQLIFHMLSNRTDLKELTHLSDALRNPTLQTTHCFHASFSRALEVCRRLDSITDTRNKNPGRVFIGDELNVDLYNEHAALVQHRLAGKEEQIAHCLVNSPASHTEIAKGLRILSVQPTGDVFKTINQKFGKLMVAKSKQEEEEVSLLDDNPSSDDEHQKGCCILI
ncbi:hypothetical protein DIZ81_02670 [Legionella taurinensis]|uniref:Uncharacterized protein n=1 Tax=Legionella taurinensis TaxID=70611 RepID=A0A3A5L928_9GAMM|nr:hypothetical protein [Legionella taurinensis]MDX1836223.1 hypothetical protein [Legionella taurinensis]PUT42017.1 hypothetical protein DB744_02675 [Legionella taurinensis]PUT44804.1 hypothetical protein DB746_02675 [Legionella taurinensis]PUT48125.1 hypothetical protein DB743_00835 [Legionella taurinensis]PUT48939.1 hypothetical protein DB745_02675 [Legionella taurinensis]